MSLIHNATFDSQTRVLSLLDKAGNVISSCEVPSKGNVDSVTKPLTFKATQNGSTVKLTKNGSPTGSFQTSRDGGKTWVDYTLNTAITLNIDDEVSFRTSADRTSAQSDKNYFYFIMKGKIEAWHNVMSMYRTNDFATYESVVEYAFSYLFKSCTSLTKAPVLPATTIASSCYYHMFEGCTSLTEAPVLPATTLIGGCYSSMFKGCRSLTKAPELPATTLASSCYQYMFSGCTSLVNAPVLPATTLASSCYKGMFYGCTSLVNAPVLPATTLAPYCYSTMFYGCTSLTEVPVLHATTLDDDCCQYMFSGCSSLNEVRCNIPSSYTSSQISSYASNWLSNVASTGTFYTNADANWPSGASGIPENWNRVNESIPTVDDITKPLTFKATQNGSTVTLKKNDSASGSFQTSRDGGNTWTDYTLNTAIALNIGDEVSFRAKNDRTSAQSSMNYFYFEMTGEIEAWHNVMSLYRTNDFATYESVVEGAFNRLFYGCTSLTKAPILPATTLAQYCYSRMFQGCTSLTKAPELPATTLEDRCYQYMFKGCTSLTKAPVLPATTLVYQCYDRMFEGCTSLIKAPELPATTLDNSCYSGMFDGCRSLNEVHCRIPSSYSSNDIFNLAINWLYGVASTGTFYTNADANWPSGASGIPTGWTRVNEADPTVDNITKPLTFRAKQDGSSVTLTKTGSVYGDFQASTDGGNTWSDYTIGTAITLNIGGEVSFRAKADRSAQREGDYIYFEMTGKIEAWHNVMSLYRTNDFPTYKATVSYAFNRMFGSCTSLTKAPVLPATSLSKYCYLYMFYGCTSLIEAPELPATTLNNNCYTYMFSNCTSLTKTPELPATTLADYCYTHMFSGCQSLKEVRISATKDASFSLTDWLPGVSATGDFYCDPNATIFPTGTSGIPANWNRHALSDYPATP